MLNYLKQNKENVKSAQAMEQSSQSPQPATEVLSSVAQITYAAPSYQQAAMVAAGIPTSSFPTTSSQLTYQQVQQYHLQQHQQLQAFWSERILEIEQTTDFKNHSLPLARIKKIMKAEEDVRMISAEAPAIFAKACEIFILELTLRSWINTEENKRRTVQKNDIAAAITRNDVFDFLVDIVPRDEIKEEGLGIPRAAAFPVVGAPADSVPYYYVPAQHSVAGPGMIIGKNMDQIAASGEIYGAPETHPVGYVSWKLPQGQPSQQQHTADA